MKKRTVRFLTVLLAVTMLLGIAPVNVFALTADETLEYLSYSINDDGIHITDCDISASGDLVIPDEIDGLPVTAIEERAFRYCKSISNITIPDSVTSIGEEAFYYCSSLNDVVIPDSITIIKNSTFARCSSLSNIVIPDSVTSIGDRSFSDCDSLNNIVIPDSVKSIGNHAFSECDSLSNIVIPNSVKSIGEGAFYYCYSINNVVIPDSVTSIGDSTFNNCNSLCNIVIPDSVTSIGDWAFSSCDSLCKIVIPDSVTSIGERAFSDCDLLNNVVIPYGVTSIEYGTFDNCASLSSIVIPDSVTSIGYGAFENCTSLNNVVIPHGITSIESNTFYRCISLSNIVIPDSVTSIGSMAFFSCKSLKSIVIPKNVTSIEVGTFYSCTSLSNFEIPENISSIGEGAFASCTSLTEITIPEGVTEIGYSPFIGCSKLKKIEVDENNKHYDSRENCNAIIETETNTLIQGCENTVIPESITSFGEGAFALISGLTEITIPESITAIPQMTFMGCTSLSDITIPDSITDIDDQAFDGCISLKSIYIPSSVVSVGCRLFTRCYSLDSIVVDENNPVYDSRNNCNAIIETETNTLIKGCNKSFIPDDIVELNEYAFYGCKGLKTIDIPDGITEIDYETFYGCTGVTSVHYGKNLEDNFMYMLPGLEEITVDPENPNFCVFDNALYTKDKSELLSYPLSCQDGDIYLAPECTEISDECFFECSNLFSAELGTGYSFTNTFNLFITDSEQFESLKYTLLSLPFEHIYVNGNETTDLSVINQGTSEDELHFIDYYYYLIKGDVDYDDIPEEINDEAERIENKYDEMVEAGLISKEDAYYFMCRDFQYYLIENGYLEQLEPTRETFENNRDIFGIYDDITLLNYFVSIDEAFEQYCEAVNNLYNTVTFSYRYPERAEITSFKPSVSGCGAEKVINYYESVTYTASSAAPVKEYQWYVNGEYVGSGESYTVEKPVKDYTVSVTAVYPNGYKESSDVTSVKLDKSVCKPSISECGAEKEIKYKETVTYTVSASVPAQEYQWYVNGEYVGSGESYTVENPESDYTVSVTAVYSDGSAQSSDTTSVKVKSPTFIEKIANVFEKIFNFFTSIFNKIFG